MESLLHWDFNPGLVIEEQVRRRFKSIVHFSPSSSSKEFYLVATFSSASFPLSPTSVGLALQCCIGGIASKFMVLQIGDRKYRFSVASNKVGHFIYGLRDRIWSDFICHFHLFKAKSMDPLGTVNSWHADEEIGGISRRHMAVASNLSFLHLSVSKDKNDSSTELSKFGLIHDCAADLFGASSSVNMLIILLWILVLGRII